VLGDFAIRSRDAASENAAEACVNVRADGRHALRAAREMRVSPGRGVANR
jgi:hypothetical protein